MILKFKNKKGEEKDTRPRVSRNIYRGKKLVNYKRFINYIYNAAK